MPCTRNRVEKNRAVARVALVVAPDTTPTRSARDTLLNDDEPVVDARLAEEARVALAVARPARLTARAGTTEVMIKETRTLPNRVPEWKQGRIT